MLKLKISYCVTCHNEENPLDNLLSLLINVVGADEIILQDDYSNNPNTINIIDKYKQHIIHHQYHLNNNYGQFKNQFIQKASGNFLFAIDADELPSELTIGENLHSIIESNPTIEAYAVPRVNAFIGVNENHAKQWGWHLSISPTYKIPIVNFPDYQFRIFLKSYPRISYKRRLHEKIEGYNSYVCLPAEEDYALYHDKTIEKQVETNLRYNKTFTQEENQGHNVFGNK